MAGYGKPGATELYVISVPDQLMIAAPDPTRILSRMPRVGQSEINDRFTNGFVGSAVGTSSRGIEKLYSGKRMGTTGWLVELALPTAIAFRPVTALVHSIYLISIGFLFVAIVLMKWLIAYLLRPLKAACKQLDEMSSERVQLSELDVAGDMEVSQLLTSFNRLSNLLGHRNQELLTSEHVYRSLIDNMLNGMAHCQMLYENGEPVDFIYLNVNSAFEKLTGLTEVVGKKVTDVIPGFQKHDAQLIALYGRVASTGIPEQHDYFLSSLNQWYRISVYCTTPGYFAVVFDNITERVRDEDNLRLAATAFEVDEAIVVTDAHGTILRTNQAASLASGYSVEEVRGQSTRIFKSGHHDESFYKFMWHSLVTKGRWEGEIWDRRKSGEIYPKWLNITCVKNSADVVTHYIGSYHEISEQKNAEAKLLRLNQALSEKKAQLREFACKNDAKLEHERKHIAREVHDELGQILTALRMDISFLSLRFGQTDPELKAKVMGMRATVDSAIQGVRNVASNLRPMALDMGIYLALDWLCQDFTKRTGVACLLDAKEKDVWLDDARSIVVFRIVQESLTNISRYAQATQVLVTVGLEDSLLGVEVQDNGKGFDAIAVDAKKTFGLLGMRERALALGGHLDVVSSPGQGTTVSLSVPLERRMDGAER
jgi:PAS domain S-box-containing protein